MTPPLLVAFPTKGVSLGGEDTVVEEDTLGKEEGRLDGESDKEGSAVTVDT